MKQITEDYVSYEIAKLLKEKGFDVPLYWYYDRDGILHNITHYCGSHIEANFNHKNIKDKEMTSAPTQSLALKWLRLCYDIIIDISPNLTLDDVCKGGFMAEVYQYGHVVPDGEFGCNIGDEYTYEEVVEASLLYVLKNLI